MRRRDLPRGWDGRRRKLEFQLRQRNRRQPRRQFAGDLQEDGDTIVVDAVSNVSFAGAPGPALPFVESFLAISLGADRSPTVTISGDEMDIVACASSICVDGFLFSFAGLIGGGGGGVSSSPTFGGLDETFDPARYSLSPAAVVPLPAAAPLLAGGLALLGLLTRGAARRKAAAA